MNKIALSHSQTQKFTMGSDTFVPQLGQSSSLVFDADSWPRRQPSMLVQIGQGYPYVGSKSCYNTYLPIGNVCSIAKTKRDDMNEDVLPPL